MRPVPSSIRRRSVAPVRRRASCAAGFSLPELSAALAIVAILAAVAIPSYTERLRAARRADATTALLDLASRLERRYTETSSYAGATIGSGESTDVLPDADTSEGYYTLSIVPGGTSATAFEIRATRKGGTAQAADARCGDFTLTDLELRGVTGSGSVAECW